MTLRKIATEVDLSVRMQNTVCIILRGTINDHSLNDTNYSSILSDFFKRRERKKKAEYLELSEDLSSPCSHPMGISEIVYTTTYWTVVFSQIS